MPVKPSLSLTAVWDETRAYIVREHALLLPVALATIGVATLLLGLFLPRPVPGAAPQPPRPEMLLVFPYGVLMVYGTLVLSVLALTPGISVREALRLGLRWLLRGLVAALLMGVVGCAAIVGVSLAVSLAAAVGGIAPERAVQLGLILSLPALLLLSARLALTLPALTDGASAAGAVRTSWRLTGPVMAKLVLIALGGFFLSLLIAVATQTALGSVILLAARAAGQQQVGELLVAVLVAFMAAALQIVFASYCALLYRRLAGSSRGM